jgi:hypothetical protein
MAFSSGSSGPTASREQPDPAGAHAAAAASLTHYPCARFPFARKEVPVPLFFPRNAAALAGVAAREHGRFAVSAVHAIDAGDGHYRLEVTDGRRLAVLRGRCERSQGGAEPSAGLGGAADVLVPVGSWREAFRAKGKRGQPAPVGLEADGPQFRLFAGETVVTGSAPDGRFPDVSSVLPKRPAPVAFRIDPLLLAGLLQAAAALDPVNGVGVLFYGADKPVGLIAHNDAGQFFDALLMPLT